jgi:hypothetical protein
MLENALMHRIMLRCGNGASRLFRMNVGLAWVGNATRITKTGMVLCQPNDVVIRQARPFRAGVEGMSDLVGWTSREITADDVGKTVAIYTAAEVKTETGRLRKEQAVFIDAVKGAGGIAGVVRSEADAVELITGRTK